MRPVLLAAAALLIACAPAAAQHGTTKPQGEQELLYATSDDAAVEAAKADARRTLAVFWDRLDAPRAGDSAFLIKVGLPVKDGGSEHLWATVVRRDGDDVVVRLANEPVYLPKLTLGSEVRTPVSTISDWSYERDGRKYGHFTTRVLIRRAPPEQRAQIEAVLAPTPLEPEAK